MPATNKPTNESSPTEYPPLGTTATTDAAVPTADAEPQLPSSPSSRSRITRPRHRRGRSGMMARRLSLPLQGSTDEENDNGNGKQEEDEPPRKQAATHVTRSRRRLAKIPYTIRPLQLRDLQAVFDLGNHIFTASEFPNIYRTWDDFTIIEHLDGSPEYCFVAETKSDNKSEGGSSRLIAFLLGETMTKSKEGTRGYVQWVAVDALYRRHGIATTLLQHYVQQAQRAGISRLLADTPSDNHPAIAMFHKVGLHHAADHVYLTRRIPKDLHQNPERHVDPETLDFEYSYTCTPKKFKGNNKNATNKHKVTIRNMEIGDLHPVYLIGDRIFTKASSNLYNFWDEHLVMQSFLADCEFCAVATVQEDSSNSPRQEDNNAPQEKVIGFSFGTTIEKPKSSWKYGYLVWLGCSPDYQGMGVASHLYHVMMELFATEKCRIIMIDTQQNNIPALSFFRKMGFGNEEEHVYLSNAPHE